MIKAEILEALPKLNAEERREIRAKLNELDRETWFDNGELSEQQKAIIEARLDEYNRNPMSYRLRIRLAAEGTGSSCQLAACPALARPWRGFARGGRSRCRSR